MTGTPKVQIEQDRHRLQLTHDDVAQDPQEWKDPFRVGRAATELTA